MWEEELLVYMISHWRNVSHAVTLFMSENFSDNDFLILFYIALALSVPILITLYYILGRIRPTFYPNTFLPDYPIFQLDLKTLKGRRRCYDEFCLHSLKRYQFEKYVGYRTKWFNLKARKRLFLMHMDLSVYEAMREAMCGSNANGTEINEMLNK
jgi:hypothetical protein